MYDSIITLIAETNTVDEYGDTVTVETERTIFAEVKSIGQTEFYQAWTLYEAEYKLGGNCEDRISFGYGNYVCSLAVAGGKIEDINIYDLGIDEVRNINSIKGRKLDVAEILSDPRVRIK